MSKVRIHCEANGRGLSVLYMDPKQAREELHTHKTAILWEEILDTTGNRVWHLAPMKKFKTHGWK